MSINYKVHFQRLNASIVAFRKAIIFVSLIIFSANLLNAKEPFTFTDIMKFNALRLPEISDDGKFLSYVLRPERGDPKIIIQPTDADTSISFEQAASCKISKNSVWAAIVSVPKALEIENLEKGKERPKNAMILYNFEQAKENRIESVQKFDFSNDSKWLAYKLYQDESSKSKDKNKKITGSDLILRHLESEAELTFRFTTEFSFDSLSNYLVFAREDLGGEKNGLYYIDLKGNLSFPMQIFTEKNSHYSSLAWYENDQLLSFIVAKEDKEAKPDSCSVFIWKSADKTLDTVLLSENSPKDWFIPFKNQMKWTQNGERLFFGLKPYIDTVPKEEKVTFTESTFYDIDSILKKREIDIWHSNDPRIKPHQKIWWKENKDRTFLCVYHFDTKQFIQLADIDLPQVLFAENPNFLIAYDDTPYLREITFNGWFHDLYIVNVNNGERKIIQKRMEEGAALSPFGQYVAFFKNKVWYLYDTRRDSTFDITSKINVDFYQEDWDIPSEPRSYGIGGWLKNDDAILLYDKYDIWKVFTSRGNATINLTAAEGRISETSYRIRNLDRDKRWFTSLEYVYLTGFNHKTKETAIFNCNLQILGTSRILDEGKKLNLIRKAKNADRILYTRESYDEFPNIWLTDSAFSFKKKLTDANPQMADFNWGRAELVDWTIKSGDTLQGIVIKPEDFNPKKRYPVVIYFYEQMSDGLHSFNQPYTGHNWCFPQYVSDGYVVFKPDVKYTTGFPGESALESVNKGVQKLISLGIADSNAIGIWGHSWSGYQAAYMITQTDLYAAAIAGCPVGNMTSAYSGIRHESGLARQFQYEKQQSRIGGSIFDSLENYIKNSPIFYAQKARTPFLIMFGDKDPKVPWEQGIELYLAFRRAFKNVVFLEYRNEAHWPERYPNRLDYAIKIKEFFDTYLKKTPAPDWIIRGVEYDGR
ncbi:MAG: S9 family peptidase [Ignavibacteria bacterium]|jgi:dipeptidyl aminopeptidase/acylaminoacyl peptidase|nr:S9 family peptidase [Ignavibacteria bacterium]